MDQIDVFPEHISTTMMPVTLPEKPDALEYAARQGHVRACILYQEPNTKRVFVLFCKDNWHKKKTLVDNFKRAILESKHVNEFRPDDVLWEKISKGMLRNPDRLLKNTDKRMVYIYNNMFFVKKDFTFGFRTVKSGEIHLIQMTHVPMLICEFPSSSLRCRANPHLFRRYFEPFDQMLYHRMVLETHTAYPIPAGTRYILLTVQKTVFGLDLSPK
ncbi:integrase catalytic domain-containing protein [Trichonephila clavipes]|nr:integrase catalytic domain-containing protein [Trichonephila clavipes]